MFKSTDRVCRRSLRELGGCIIAILAITKLTFQLMSGVFFYVLTVLYICHMEQNGSFICHCKSLRGTPENGDQFQHGGTGQDKSNSRCDNHVQGMIPLHLVVQIYHTLTTDFNFKYVEFYFLKWIHESKFCKHIR